MMWSWKKFGLFPFSLSPSSFTKRTSHIHQVWASLMATPVKDHFFHLPLTLSEALSLGFSYQVLAKTSASCPSKWSCFPSMFCVFLSRVLEHSTTQLKTTEANAFKLEREPKGAAGRVTPPVWSVTEKSCWHNSEPNSRTVPERTRFMVKEWV